MPAHHAPTILHEDNHLLVICKPAGMPSQGDASGDESVVAWAERDLARRHNKPGKAFVALLHRLDRPVGGVMALGKTSKGAARLSKQFQERSIEKHYLAVVQGAPPQPQGRLLHHVRKLEHKNIVRAHDKPVPDSKPAELSYKLLAQHTGRSLLQVELHTGRRHQIRVQLAAMGCVILGDVKYGKADFLPDKDIALWAYSLSLTHPTTKERLHVTAPPPGRAPWSDFALATLLP